MTNTINYSTNNNNFNDDNDDPLTIAIIIACVIISLFLGSINTWYDKTHYSNVAFVDTITIEEVLLVDSCGDVWAVDAIPNVKEGDLVNVYFYNNGTTYTHTDDVITYVRKID